MHFLCPLTGKRIEDLFQVASHEGFVYKQLSSLTFLMRQDHGKCDLDFRKPGSSESPHGNSQYLDWNFNIEMVIGSDAEILVRLLLGRLLGRESTGKF